MFADESGFQLTPTRRRSFAPRGETPMHTAYQRHDRISAISALTLSPQRHKANLFFELLPDDENVTGTHVVAFLRQLRRHIPGPIILVWDRAQPTGPRSSTSMWPNIPNSTSNPYPPMRRNSIPMKGSGATPSMAGWPIGPLPIQPPYGNALPPNWSGCDTYPRC